MKYEHFRSDGYQDVSTPFGFNNLFIANMQPLSFGKFPYDFDLLVEIFCGSINVFVYSWAISHSELLRLSNMF